LHIHGTLDDTILYGANLPPEGNADQNYTIGADATVERWAAVDGCAADLTFVERRDYHQRIRDGSDPAETEVYRSHDCDSGRTVELWKAINADHIFLSINARWRDDVAAFLSQ
jgi:poly(3-hydroxybutyrate) depolymerase